MGVPNFPGVPALASYADDVLGSLLSGDGIGVFDSSTTDQWGIFLDGSAVVTADTVTRVNYKREWAVSDFPVEQGSFSSYNKVQIPFDARVRFTSGGSESNRAALLNSVASIADDTVNLYTVVTPEETYPSVTITHYEYSRTATDGVGLLSVDVWCLNVNQQSATTTLSNTQSPSGASQQNGGTVQAQSSPTGGTIQASNLPSFPGQP